MVKNNPVQEPEPWLRGTLLEVPVVARAAIHALELAKEDLHRWTRELTEEELNLRPSGLASVAFHLRHISGSLDRLLTYAEGRQLVPGQITFLRNELNSVTNRESLLRQVAVALAGSEARIRALANVDLDTVREVGREKRLSTVGSLLVHVADHTQRHVGQAVTTAKLVLALRTNIFTN